MFTKSNLCYHVILTQGSRTDAENMEIWERRVFREIDIKEARGWYNELPRNKRIATLSPDYCAIDALRDENIRPVHLLYTDQDRDTKDNIWLMSGHLGRVPNSDMLDMTTAYCYGGPVVIDIEVIGQQSLFTSRAEGSYHKWCQKNNVVAEFMRFHPLLDQPYPNQKKENRITYVVPVDTKYNANCRNKCNKAWNAGVVVKRAKREDIKRFAADYRKGLDVLKADKFYYFNDAYFAAMSQWDKAHLLIAEIDDCWLSAGIFLEGGDTLEYHLCTTNARGYDLAANNVLIDAALLFCKELGLKQLYLGGGKTPELGDPLLEFKRSFGGVEKKFYVGQQIFKPEVYYAMRDAAFDVAPTQDRVLFWR